eukprot:g13666.t1
MSSRYPPRPLLTPADGLDREREEPGSGPEPPGGDEEEEEEEEAALDPDGPSPRSRAAPRRREGAAGPGVSLRRSVLTVCVLCYINLLNYMDRFTVAGEQGRFGVHRG